MKIGMIARCENRGLGNLTREWYEHMNPDLVMLWMPSHDLPLHKDWYPGALWMPHGADYENDVREALSEIDVLYSAETMYDWRIAQWARDAGCKTVCHMMPEYFRAEHFIEVDQWWTPTRWRLNHLPRSTRVVPVPIATKRYEVPEKLEIDGPIHWLHPAGARARKDRNGTMLFLQALGHLREQHVVTVASQDAIHSMLGPAMTRNVEMRWLDEVDHYWENYQGQQAVVLPRKYGGLCLPALEGMGAYCALLMTNAKPQQDEWPIIALPTDYSGEIHLYNEHRIPLAISQPEAIAASMDACARQPEVIAHARARSYNFARQNSWEVLEPMIRYELERVVMGRV